MLGVGASDHLQATCSPEPRGGALGAHPRSPFLCSSPCPAPEAASQRNWPLSPRKLRGPQSWPTGAWGRRYGRVTVPQTRDWLLPALSLSKTGITEQWGQVHGTRPGLGSNSGLTTSETTNLEEATLLPPTGHTRASLSGTWCGLSGGARAPSPQSLTIPSTGSPSWGGWAWGDGGSSFQGSHPRHCAPNPPAARCWAQHQADTRGPQEESARRHCAGTLGPALPPPGPRPQSCGLGQS